MARKNTEENDSVDTESSGVPLHGPRDNLYISTKTTATAKSKPAAVGQIPGHDPDHGLPASFTAVNQEDASSNAPQRDTNEATTSRHRACGQPRPDQPTKRYILRPRPPPKQQQNKVADGARLNPTAPSFPHRPLSSRSTPPQKASAPKKPPTTSKPTATAWTATRQHRDPIIATPIPVPTTPYLSQITSLPPTTLPQPRRLLLVLDLNGVLIHRPNRDKPKHFLLRPGAAELLAYVFAHHHVMVWTSAKRRNATAILEKLLSEEQRALLVAVWAREELGLSKADEGRRVQVYKRLERVWGDDGVRGKCEVLNREGVRGGDKWTEATGNNEGRSGGSEVWRKVVWDQSNTVLVDDSTMKAAAQPWNCLEVKEWVGEEGDVELMRVRGVLEHLAVTSDVGRWFYQKHVQGKASAEKAAIDDVSAGMAKMGIGKAT